jgi:hypothetical protein
MAVDALGRVFLSNGGFGNGMFFSFNADLSPRWSIAVPNINIGAPAIGRDGTLIVAGVGTNVKAYRTPNPGTSPICFGDGSSGACPCANSGGAGRGCANSANPAGARLAASGAPSLANDTLLLTSSGELPAALSIFLQGTTQIVPAVFGDGLRCVGGNLKRLYSKNAVAGVATAPQAGDPSVSARSAALNDPLLAGSVRYLQTYYRDPSTSFCPAPQGSTFNISSGLSVTWAP